MSKRDDKYLSNADACLYAELSGVEGAPFCEFRAVLCEHHGGHDACAVREMELVKALREVDAFAPHANECAIFGNSPVGGFVVHCDCFMFNVRVALELAGQKPRGTGQVTR